MVYDQKKPEKKEQKIETRYYDELFKDLQEKEPDYKADPELLEIFYNNLVEELSEKETELKKCLYSYHVDYFVWRSDLSSFAKILNLLTRDAAKLSEYVNDRRISRAYEACLICIGGKLAEDKSSNEEALNELKSCMKKLGNFLEENLQTIFDTQDGIYLMRSFLRVIGANDPLDQLQPKQNTNKRKEREFNIKHVEVKLMPEEWKLNKFIKKFAEKIEDINLLEAGLSPTISPCVSLLLRKLYTSYPSKSESLIRKIHEQFMKKSSSFHSMIQDAVGSHFIESYLYTCPVDLLTDHYLDKHILPNLVAYSKHTYANYPVQALIKHRLENETNLKVLYDALLENLDSIVDLHTDLIYKNYMMIDLIDACHKSNFDMDHLVKKIMEFFGCDSEENRIHFLRMLLVFEKKSDIEKEATLDQALFMFDIKPIACTIAFKLVECGEKLSLKSFNNLNSNEIERLCTDNSGSYFIQNCLKLFNSKDRTVWLQSFFDKLKGRLLNLCTNRTGSFIIETMWSISNLKQRIAIADELKSSESQFRNDQYGRFIHKNLGIEFYKRKPEEWKQIQTNEFKKRKLFADLIDDKDNKQEHQEKITKKNKK